MDDLTIETCRFTLEYPGMCCVCDEPARYAVLTAHRLPAVTLMREHLRCVDCAARDRDNPDLQAMKDYHPRPTEKEPAPEVVHTEGPTENEHERPVDE